MAEETLKTFHLSDIALEFDRVYHIRDIMEGKGFRDFSPNFLREQLQVGAVIFNQAGQHELWDKVYTTYERTDDVAITYRLKAYVYQFNPSDAVATLRGLVDVENDTFVLYRGLYVDLSGYQVKLAAAEPFTAEMATARLREDYSREFFDLAMRHYKEHPEQIPVRIKDLVDIILKDLDQ